MRSVGRDTERRISNTLVVRTMGAMSKTQNTSDNGDNDYSRIQQELELLPGGEGLFRQKEYAQGEERIE